MSLISLVLIRSARMYLGVIFIPHRLSHFVFFSFFVWDFNVIPASDTISAIYPEGETTTEPHQRCNFLLIFFKI